jgi:dCMP deaminase
MQQAVDIVHASTHPRNKIAALLSGHDREGRDFTAAHTNYWPGPIKEHIGMQTRIGSASGTVHAETACIIASPCTAGSSFYVTDPFCPNCAKNMAEAGVREIYIDHKGFEKDFVTRRQAHFKDMSLRICAASGMAVYEIRRKEKKITPLLILPSQHTQPEHKEIEIAEVQTDFLSFARARQVEGAHRPFALGMGYDPAGNRTIALITGASLPPGLTEGDEMDSTDKYSQRTEPLNRLLMNAARLGIVLDRDHLYSSRIPTAREQVNLTGAGVARLYIGDKTDSRDASGPEAMRLLERHNVMEYIFTDDAGRRL